MVGFGNGPEGGEGLDCDSGICTGITQARYECDVSGSTGNKFTRETASEATETADEEIDAVEIETQTVLIALQSTCA
jgi:hypothetical protein